MSTVTTDRAVDMFGIVELEQALALRYAARDAYALALLDEGQTQAEVAALLGITRGRVAQLVMARRRQEQAETAAVIARGKAAAANRRSKPQTAREAAREIAALAAYDQTLRCERVTAQDGYGRSEEVRAFYGDGSVATADHAERRVNQRELADSLSLAAEHRAYLDSLERAS